MAETLKELYEKLDKANIKLPDYNTFEEKYSKEGGAENLYGKLNSANIKLPSITDFKSKYFNEPFVEPKEEPGFFDGIFARFSDLSGTDKDQSRAYLKEIGKKQQGNIAAPEKSDWDVYNDLTNLLKPYGKKSIDPQDYINTDNYLKSLNVQTNGSSDDKDNPFSFNFGEITDKDQYLKVKDDIENVKKKKIESIRNAYDAQIDALDQNLIEYGVEQVGSFLGFDNDITKLKKQRDKEIDEVEDQFNSYVSNINQPQIVKTNTLLKPDALGIAQLNKNISLNPITNKQEFNTLGATKDINESTGNIKKFADSFNNLNSPSIPEDATEEEKQAILSGKQLDKEWLESGRPIPKEGFTLNSELYNKFGKYGIDLEYSNDNKQRDIATSNFNYGQIKELEKTFLAGEPKTTDIEKDKFVFNGLKAQVQTIDNYIKATQGYIDKLSEGTEGGTDPNRKQNIDFLNSLNGNITALKNLRENLVQWGDKNLSGYKKYLSSQEEIQRIANESPVGEMVSEISKAALNVPSDIVRFGEKIGLRLRDDLENKKISTEYGSKRYTSLEDFYLKQMYSPKLKDVESTVFQKGLNIPLSKAEAIYKSKEGSVLNPFNYTYSIRPLIYNTATQLRDMALLGATGSVLEKAGSKVIGTGLKMVTEGASKEALGWTLEKQIAKNLVLAGAAEKTGESILKYQLGNIGLAGAKIGNRVVAMVVPTAALYGDQMHKQFMDAGFTPEQTMKLTALSVLFEGGSEAIFGNEIRLYNALVDGTTDAALKNTATSVLERAFADRAKKMIGKELSGKELGTLTKFWTNLQKFKNSRGVSSIVEGLKMGGEESLEEISTNLGNALFTSSLGRSYNPEYKGEEFTLENQALTTLNTIATMLPSMGMSGGVHFRDYNKNEKIEGLQAKYEVGFNPDVHIGVLSEAFNKGELPKEEYEKRVVLVNKYADYVKKSTDGAKIGAVKNKLNRSSEVDALRLQIFNAYLEKDKLETLFTQALNDEDKANFAQLIAEKDQQIINYVTNGLYENEEQRRKINTDSLDYLFNPLTVKAYNNEKKLTTVMDQLVTQSLTETDQDLVKKYEEKINLLDVRKKEIIAKQEEDKKTPEEVAAQNNANQSITIPGIGIGELQLQFNTPYYFSSNKLTTTEEGQQVRTNELMTILKDNGDGTLQVSIEGEEKAIPISDIANSRILKEETVKKWKDRNSPIGFVFEHENDGFTYEFDKPTKLRDKVVQGRIVYNGIENTVELEYKNKKGETVRYSLTKQDISNLNKGRLKYVKTYETAEQFNKRKAKMEELAKSINFEELSDEPLRRWQFINEFIQRKTDELANTKELIKTVQQKLNEAKKTLNSLVNDINSQKPIDIQTAIDAANNLKEQVSELEWNLQVLEEQQNDLEEQIEYTKRYDQPEFDTTKTLVNELIEDQFKLEVQLEKVNGVIDSLKEMISNITDIISDILNVIDSVYEKAKTLYPKIPIDNTRWSDFVRENPNITKLKPEFAKDLTLFNTVINDNLDKIEVEDKRVEDLNKSIEANVSLAKTIQDQIRFQEELIREAVKNQKKYEEEKVTEKVKKRAAEIFGTVENNQSDNNTNDIDEDQKLVKEESEKIPLEIFFNTATSGVTIEDGLNLNNPAVLRLQKFSNTVQNPENYSFLVVTADNAKQYGLEDIIYSNEKTTNTGDNEDNYDIKLVIIDKKTKRFVNENGEETTNPKQYVYTSLRKANTVWSNGEKAYPVRKGKEEVDEKIAKLYEEKHKQLRSELITQIKNGVSQKLNIQYVSRGRKVNEGKLNPVVKTAIPANTDLTNQKVIVVAKGKDPQNKTGQLTYGNGNVIINMPVGRPVLSLGNTFEFLHNRKFTKKDIDKFVRIFKALYDSYKTGDVNTRNTILEYLKKTLYFRNPAETSVKEAQETKIGRSQIWLSNVLGIPYLNLGSEGGRIPFNFEEGNVNAFFSLYAFFIGKEGKGVYHNVDIKNDGEGLIGKPFIEITDVKDGKIVTREWPSYQDYLLSDKYPTTGAIRPTEEIPLTVKMEPSTPDTPNRAGRYLVYENSDNDDVTKANPRVTVVEKTAKGKEVKKGKTTTAPKDSQVKLKEVFSEDIQDLKKLKPNTRYRWKNEKEGKVRYIDFILNDKMFVKVIDSNYTNKGELVTTGEVGKLLHEYIKGEKTKPVTVVVYELQPVDEGKTKSKEETKKTGKKEAPKKTTKKKAKEEEEEIEGDEDFDEDFQDVSGIDLKAWALEKDTEDTKGKPTAGKVPTKNFKDEEGKTELINAFDALFKSSEEIEGEEGAAEAGKEEFRKAVKEEYIPENLEQAKVWWEERFPKVPFNVVFGLINNKAWGMIKNATVTLSNVAEQGTIYHEGFEVVHKYILSPKEVKALYKEFKRREGSFIDYETGKTVKYSQATNYQIKEQLAEEYREYELSGRTKLWKGEYRKKTLFEKISDFVDLIVNTLLGSPDNIETVFRKISNAAYKDHALPAVNNEINPEYRVAKGAKSLKRTNPILFRRIMDSMTNLLFNSLRESNKPIIDVLTDDFKIADELNNIKTKLDSFYNVNVYSKSGKSAKIRDIANAGTKEQFKELFKDMEVVALFFKNNNGTALMQNLVDLMKEHSYINKAFTLDITNENIAKKAAAFYNALQSGGSSVLFDAISNYNYISDNWADITKEHKDFLAKYSIEFETDEETIEDAAIVDENSSSPDYAAEVTQVSKKQNAAFEIKLLIATLREMVFDYTKPSKYAVEEVKSTRPKINELLLSNVVDYGKVFSDLLYKLSPATNMDEMFEILQKEAETNAVISTLVTKLKIGQTNLNDSDIDLQSKFYVSMNSLLVKYSKLLLFTDSKMSNILDLNELDDFNTIREKWVSATVSNDSKIIKLDKNTKQYKLVENFPFEKIENINKAFDFLNYLGYEFNFNPNILDANDKETVLKSAINLLKVLKTTSNPEVVLQDSGTIRNSLNELAAVYMKYASTYAEPQHLNIERQPVQNIILHNFIGTIAKTMNSSKTLAEFIQKVPQLNPKTIGNGFLTFSQILNSKSKFYRDGVLSKKLSIQIMEGSEVIEAGMGTPTSKLTLKDRIAQEFAYNLNGLYYILTPADTKTQWGINFGEFITQEQARDIPTITRIFKEYLKAEIVAAQQENIANLDRLEQYHDKEKTKKIGGSLRFFRDILPFDLDLTKTPDEAIREKENEINKAIIDYIEEDVEETFNFFEKEELITSPQDEVTTDESGEKFVSITNANEEPKYVIMFAPAEFMKEGLTKKEIKELIRYSNINYTFNIFEQHKLFWGDPAQWKDISKRVKSFTSGRNLSVNRYTKFNDHFNKKLNTITFIDENADTKEVILQPGDFGYVNYNDEIRTSTYLDVTVENSNLEGYDKTNEADAQGAVFPNGYREIRQRATTWNEADEEQYQWDTALCRWEVTNGIKWEDRNKQNPESIGIKENLYPDGERGELLKKHDESLLKRGNPFLVRKQASLEEGSIKTAVTNVLKPIYSGFKKAFVDAKGNRTEINAAVVNLDKLSLAPMTWRLVRGKQAQKFFIEHFKKNTTYIKFESAQKVGMRTDVENLYTSEGEINTKNIKHDILDFKYFGIQVETKTQKDTATLGSQLTKLITLNVDKIKNKVLVENNSRFLRALKEMSKRQIFNDFGIEETTINGEKVYKFKNFETVYELIQQEFKKRETPENLKDAMQLDENGNFYLKFDMIIGSERVESIITSIIDKNILRPKMFGGQMPQIASTLFEQNKRFVKKMVNGKPVMTSNELKFYEDKDGERYCEVYLPFYMKEFIEQGKELTIDSIPDNLRFGIGFRIPTQNTNSIENFKIKGFLPVEYGNSIVVPSEITTKAGSDFDIDKLNIYLYNYFINKEGKPEKIKFDERPSYNKDGSVSDAAKERYDINEKRRDPEAIKIRKEYRAKIKEIKEQINEQWKKDDAEIKQMKSQKKISETEIDQLFVAKKELQEKIKQLEKDLKDTEAVLKDFEKGFNEDYDTAKLAANNIFGYPGDKFSILNQMDQEIESIKNNIEEYQLEVNDLTDKLKDISLTKYRKEVIDKKFEEKNKNNKYLQNLKQDLIKREAEEINAIVPKMSLEEFAKLPIEMQNSRKAVENAYVDNIRAILELPEMFKFLIKPNSAEELKQEAKDINSLYGINKEQKPSTYYISRLRNAEDRHAFLVGKDAVGIAASHQTQHAISQLVNLSFSTLEKPLFNLFFDSNYTVEGNKVIYSLSGVYDKAGKLISDSISMFIDAAVDIAKDPYVFDINANYNTYSIYLTGIRLGIPLPILTRWFNQPIIREYVKIMQENKSISTQLSKEKLTKDQIISKAQRAINPIGDGQIVTSVKKEGNYTIEELEDLIKEYVKSKEEKTKNSLEFKQNQYLILDQFLLLETLSWDLFRFGQAINLDTSRTVSFESIRIKIFKIKAALEGPFSDHVVKVFKETFIGSIYKTKNEFLEAIKPLYLTESDKARKYLNPILESIYSAMSSQDLIEEEARDLKKHFVNYLIHTLPITFDGAKNPITLTSKIKELQIEDTPKLASNKLRELQVLQKSGKLPENFFTNNLLGSLIKFAKLSGKTVNNIQPMRRILDKTDLDLTVADWRNLNDNIETYNLSQTLLKTALLQSGIITDPKSFSQVIPNEMFEDLAKQIQDYFDNISGSDLDDALANFKNSYYQNQWYNRDLIPKATKKTKGGKPRKVTRWIQLEMEGKKYNFPTFQYYAGSNFEDASQAMIPKEGKSPFIIDISVKKLPAKQIAQMKKAGDFSFINFTLYKRIEIKRPDGKIDVPLARNHETTSKGIERFTYWVIYYPVYRYGQKFTSIEHYNSENRKSQVNSQTVYPKDSKPLTDVDVINQLQEKGKLSELFLYQDILPNLAEKDEDTITEVKKFMGLNEEKETIDSLFEEAIIEPTVSKEVEQPTAKPTEENLEDPFKC